MNKALIALFAAVFSLVLVVDDAEARRIGGGRSSGMQRNVTPQSPTAPAQNAVPAKPTQAQPAAAPQPSGMSRWLGPLAGLAAGIGLAAMLSHFGLGEGFASIIMMLLIGMAVFFVIRLLFRRRAPQSQPLQYAGNTPAPMRFEAPPGGGGAAASAATGSIPAGFDVDGFLRQAKLNFVRLQAANDRGDMDDIREFTSPEVFAEVKMQYQERGSKAQETDVMQLNAELLEVVTEDSRHVASVHFSGQLREDNGAPEAFAEVWHLAKPVDGSRGWNVAGIQQV
jgi:predicted lipid-binding transport protein (Tim44 family)